MTYQTKANVNFIRTNASMGVNWLAERTGLTPKQIQYLAFCQDISLRRQGNRNGRPRKPDANRRAISTRLVVPDRSHLPFDHPVIQMRLQAMGKSDKSRLQTSAWKRHRKRVLERDAYTCVYCGDQATAVDHVIPRVNGGDDSMDNLVASCLRCNSRKGSQAPGVFLGRSLTPPVFVDNLSAKQSKPVQNGQTRSVSLSDSPFMSDSSSDQSGAS